MHDINGKSLLIGDEIHTYAYGLSRIDNIFEEHDEHAGGALIRIQKLIPGVTPDGRSGDFIIRTHVAKAIKVRSWKELASEAAGGGLQNACNLSGVLVSFCQVIREVSARLEAEGKKNTSNINQHPICQLYADKVAHLTGTQTLDNDAVSQAYKWAYDMMEGKS